MFTSRIASIRHRTILRVTRLDDRTMPAVGFSVLGAPVGSLPIVTVLRPDGSTLANITAYDPSFRGGVNAAVGEIDGNPNTVEIVTGAGPGGGPHVKVFSVNIGNGIVNQLASFFAFNANFRGGVNVAAGDLGNDYADEVIAAAGPSGGPDVRAFSIFNGQPQQLPHPFGDFYAFEGGFRGGVRVVAGNLDGNINDGSELVVGAGPGGGPHVRIFNKNGLVTEFFAFNAADTTGISFAPITTVNQLTVFDGAGQGAVFTFNGSGGYTRTALVPGSPHQLLRASSTTSSAELLPGTTFSVASTSGATVPIEGFGTPNVSFSAVGAAMSGVSGTALPNDNVTAVAPANEIP